MDNHEKNNWKYYSAGAAYFIIMLICWDTPCFMGWYDTLLGEQGLKNVIAIVRMSIVTGCLMTVPLMIMVFCGSMATFFERKIIGVLMFIIGTALSAALSVSVSSSFCHFNIQCREIGIYSSMQNFKLMNACIKDLKNDEYEGYTINYTSTYHQKDSFRSSTGFYEYGVHLMYGTESLVRLQIGDSEYDRFNEKPLSGFDGAVTVYKNSGFLRSYEPSVDYTEEEAREHIFTVYVNEGKIYCKQNAELRNPGGCYLWTGYRKGEITDYYNYILDEDIRDTDPYFDPDWVSYYFNKENGSFYTSDDLDQICICLRKGDFSCERVSNIISLDDYGIAK